MQPEPVHQKPWDWRAGIQFICGGTGAGLLLFTALAGWQTATSTGSVEADWLPRTGYLALLFLATGLLSVWVKLGRRWRALFVILNPRTSWMSREALLALPLFVLAGGGVFFGWPGVVTAAAALGMGFLLAQAKMLEAARGIPAWRIRLIVPLIFVTGLVEGGSVFALVAAVFGGVGVWLPLSLFILLALRLWVWRAYYAALTVPGGAPIGTVKALSAIQKKVVRIGHIAPLGLLPLGLLLGKFVPGATAIITALAGIVAIYGGWLTKFTIITRAAFNQGFALKRTPARTPEYAGPGTKPGWEK